MDPRAKIAMKQLEILKKRIAQRKSHFEGMTEQEVIHKLRKDRERIGESKVVTHS